MYYKTMIIKIVLKLRTAVCQVTTKRSEKTLTEDSYNTYIYKKKTSTQNICWTMIMNSCRMPIMKRSENPREKNIKARIGTSQKKIHK